MIDLNLRLNARSVTDPVGPVTDSLLYAGSAERRIGDPDVSALSPTRAPGVLNLKRADVAGAIRLAVVVADKRDAMASANAQSVRIPDVVGGGADVVPCAIHVKADIAWRAGGD